MWIFIRPEESGYNLAGYPAGGSQKLGGWDLPDYGIKTHLTYWSFAQRFYLPEGFFMLSVVSGYIFFTEINWIFEIEVHQEWGIIVGKEYWRSFKIRGTEQIMNIDQKESSEVQSQLHERRSLRTLEVLRKKAMKIVLRRRGYHWKWREH